MSMEVQFQHTLFTNDGSEDVDVEAVVDVETQLADLKIVKQSESGQRFRLTKRFKEKLEAVAVEVALDLWADEL